MTLSEARAAAAGAIRAAATAAQVRRVLEVDVLHERQIPAIAKGLTPAHTGTRGTSGPADVCVMATGRRASQGIGITAVLIILDRVDLDPEWTGSGRGLAVHDVVAGALEGLPGHGLPRLLVESSMEQLPVAVQEAQAGEPSIRSSDPRVALHVFTLHVEWPPAFPVDPLASDVDSSTQAIREHVGAAITTGLPADSDAQAGAEEADRREAVIAGTVPRAWIVLRTQRESIGGAPRLRGARSDLLPRRGIAAAHLVGAGGDPDGGRGRARGAPHRAARRRGRYPDRRRAGGHIGELAGRVQGPRAGGRLADHAAPDRR